MRPRFGTTGIVTLAVGLVGSPVFADDGQMQLSARLAQAPTPDCVCRAQGRTFSVGESACLRTPMGARLAQCGMVLNNTSWTFTERPCPES